MTQSTNPNQQRGRTFWKGPNSDLQPVTWLKERFPLQSDRSKLIKTLNQVSTVCANLQYSTRLFCSFTSQKPVITKKACSLFIGNVYIKSWVNVCDSAAAFYFCSLKQIYANCFFHHVFVHNSTHTHGSMVEFLYFSIIMKWEGKEKHYRTQMFWSVY